MHFLYVASYHRVKQKKKAHSNSQLEKTGYCQLRSCKNSDWWNRKQKIRLSLIIRTVERRIVKISDEVLEQTVSQVKESPFHSVQLNKRTDIASQPQFSVLMPYVDNDEVSDEVLFCKALQLYTEGQNVFQCLAKFFSEHSIPWEKYPRICTDSAAACTGNRKYY